jgi:hypothetical protein
MSEYVEVYKNREKTTTPGKNPKAVCYHSL